MKRIVFYPFLNESQTGVLSLPVKMLRLLDYLCQKGHPVAIRFYNEVMRYVGTPVAMGMLLDKAYITPDSSCDLEVDSNKRIVAQPL